MEWLGYERCLLADIRKPEDWPERLERARAGELAGAIGQTRGPINAPVIDKAAMDIVAGADRLASLEVSGETHAEVRAWLGSPAEKELVRASENLHRRGDGASWRARYLKAWKALREEAKELPDTRQEKRKPGRPKTAEGEAREGLATALGISVNAIEKQESRARLQEESEHDSAPRTPRPVPLIETRIKGELLRPIEELRDVLMAFVDELTQNAHDAHRLLERAARARAELETAVGMAVEAIERGRKNIAAASRPEAREPGEAPRRGLGGRKLQIQDEEGRPIPLEPEHDTEVVG